jgi:FMN phosphatase YigB (HAD superfamily)
VPARTDTGIPIYDRTKGEYLAWLKQGDVLVDDSLENVEQASLLGLKTLLYPQPWNRGILTTAALLQKLSEMDEES